LNQWIASPISPRGNQTTLSTQSTPSASSRQAPRFRYPIKKGSDRKKEVYNGRATVKRHQAMLPWHNIG